MITKETIQQLAAQFAPWAVEVRRHMHMHPELSFEEVNTSAFIAKKLQELEIEFKSGFVKTGLVAHVSGKKAHTKTIALRADMDALPITELNKSEYTSLNSGVMHACGHDVHTACVLGALKILKTIAPEFGGTVKALFQPGEEKLPGGASLMIKEGALLNPDAASITGQHVFPELEAGKVGFRSGMYMASTDEIYVTVTGKGGHGAMPHQVIDPVLISAHLIVALQQIVSRRATPTLPTVLSFGKIIGNGATNVIPNEVKLEGTFRTFDEKWREQAHYAMKKLANSLVESMGGTCDFHIEKGYPFLVNNPELTAQSIQQAQEYLGAENVVNLDLRMTAEDFAFYSQQLPAVFYRLGTRNEARGITSGVHTPTFDVDEKAIETGMGLMAWLALNQLATP